jgi:hypothetical protein
MGVLKIFCEVESKYSGGIGAHAKFVEPSDMPFCEKSNRTGEQEEKNTPLIVTTTFHLQRPRAASAHRSVNMKW